MSKGRSMSPNAVNHPHSITQGSITQHNGSIPQHISSIPQHPTAL
jgi:hypothetical protein